MNKHIKIAEFIILSVFYLFACVISLAINAKNNHLPINFNQLTSDDGLSQSYVYRIVQDNQGFIWVGTQDGLNRYDGHEFLVYRNQPNNPHSIASNDVRVLFLDSKNKLWVGTQGKGLSRYDAANGKFTNYSFDQGSFFNSSNVIIEIIEAPSGELWIGTRGGLTRFNPNTGEFKNFIINEQRTGLGNQVRDLLWLKNGRILLATGEGLRVFNPIDGKNSLVVASIAGFEERNFGDFTLDDKNNIWVGSIEGGLYRIATAELSREVSQANAENKYLVEQIKGSPKLGRILNLYKDKQGRVWVGTRANGLYFFDQATQEFVGYQSAPGEPTSLSSNTVMDIFQDRTGLYWVGTWSGGINTFNLNKQAFRNFVSVPYNQDSLAGKNVWDVMRTKNGDYWFGTNDGGLTRYSPNSDTYQNFTYQTNDPESLSGNQVWALGEREDGLLWVGTYFSGVDLFNPQTGKVVARYNQNTDRQAPFPHAAINMTQTKDGVWWFATRLQGLAKWQEESQSFKFYLPDENNPNALSGIKVFDLFQDSKNRFWIGTENSGLSLYRKESDDFESFRHDPNNPQSIVSDEVLALGEDDKGRLLVGTDQGISRHEGDGVFSHITKNDGLLNDTINGLLKGCDGNVWAATNKSLSRIDKQDKIVNFTKQNGLVSTEFNTTASQYGKNCELLFGSANGAISFIPKNFSQNEKPELMLTKVLKFYNPINVGQSLEDIEEVSFSFEEKVVSFAYALVDFNNPNSHEFRYRIFDSESVGQWINLGKQNLVSLTNLSPGDHLLEVQGRTDTSGWSDIRSLRIIISPPWWLSWWAYLGYLVVAVSIIFTYLRLQSQKLQAQKQLTENERQVTAKLRKIDKLKDEFLANTSHEIRTPLNAIIGLSDLAIMENAQKQADTEIDSTLKLIRDSGDRLLTLVSDILDYSALSENKLRINKEAISIEPIINNLILEIKLLNQNPKIEVLDDIEHGIPLIYADEHRLYQILLNLLSNALKFTESGFIKVTAKQVGENIKITIQDSGIGIPQENLDSIYNRFEQLDGSLTRRSGGTGLGLAISKELVELHNGTIEVKSVEGKGSTFIVTFPRT